MSLPQRLGKKNYFNLNNLFIVFSLLIIILLKLIFYVPDIENGGDAVKYYKIGIDVSNLDFTNFEKHHFYFRWGVWVNSLIANLIIPNNILSYYLSNFIPFWIGILIFSKILLRETGKVSTIFFLLIISSDPDLTRASYQLLPMGSSILPLALLTSSTIKYFSSQDKIGNLKIIYLSFLIFWLFSIRETFLLFTIVFFIIALKFRLVNHIIIFILSFFLFYIFETIIFKLMYSEYSNFGKLHFLLEDSKVLSKVWYEKSRLGRFIDNGLFSRWYKGSLLPSQSVIFFGSFIIAYLEIFKNKNIISSINILSYFIFVFFVLNTLFVISLVPVIPGLPHDSRFVAPIIPICVIVILIFLFKNLEQKNFLSITIAIFLFLNFVSINIYQAIWNYKYFEFRYSSLNKKVNFYNKFSERVKDNNCIHSKFHKRLNYHLKVLQSFDKKQNLDKFKNKKILQEGKIFVIKSDNNKCREKLIF